MTDQRHRTSGYGSGRGPLERSLEVFVYAPLGLALDARQLYPRIVDRGRSQIVLARIVGRYATRQLGGMAESALDRLPGPDLELLRLLGIVPFEDEPTVPGPPGSPRGTDTSTTPEGHVAELADAVRQSALANASPAGTGTGTGQGSGQGSGDGPAPPSAESLAITDYDSLAASQVVPRLDDLAPDELEAIRRYEAAGRGRKTILSKIAHLQVG